MLDKDISRNDMYTFFQRRQDDLGRELTRCGSPGKINELRSYVLFIQEKIKEMEMLERGIDRDGFEMRNDIH